MTVTQSRSELYYSHNPNEKNVWACLLTNEEYLRGVLTLYYSLIRCKTKYPFYVIYTDVYYINVAKNPDNRLLDKMLWIYLQSGLFRRYIFLLLISLLRILLQNLDSMRLGRKLIFMDLISLRELLFWMGICLF